MLDHILAIFSGTLFVIGIIAGIGPQNLNIIGHAIQKNYHWQVATTCFLADSVLILTGGIGLSLSNSKYIILTINIIGLIFIVIYLLQKIKGLFSKRGKIKLNTSIETKKQSVLRALALTWLNPLVFIDTIVVIGGTATQYIGSRRLDFIIGAVIGDFTWIFGITSIALIFSNQLNRPIIWKILDISTITIMSFILYKTVIFVYHSGI